MEAPLIVWFAASALAAEEPCYGHQWQNRLEGEHFWIEWSDQVVADGLATPEQIETVLASAERARRVYTEEMGFRFTERAVVVRIDASDVFSPGGQAQTRDCDGEDVPLIYLFTDIFEHDRHSSIMSHELGHAVEYAYMGSYGDAVASWLWWMEACATWFEKSAEGTPEIWAWESEGMLDHPEVALHLNAAAFLVPEWSDHMYGTAFLVQYLEDQHGIEAVRATWEYGEPLTGDILWFPDALAAQGIDWTTFWGGFLAAATVADVQDGAFIESGAARIDVDELPAGEDPVEIPPHGLGFKVVHFEPRSSDIDVVVDVDPAVPWHVILAYTDGDRPGDAVISWEALPIDEAGHAKGKLHLTRETHGWLVVSPEAAPAVPYTFTWSATGMKIAGGACATAPAPGMAWALVAGLALAARRRRWA